MGNTRPVHTNTADRAPNMSMTQGYVRVLVCTVCFQWNIHTNPVHSSAHRVVTTHYGAGGYLKERSNYVASDGQHARPSCKHCKVRQTCSRHMGTCAYTFARFPFSGEFNPTRTSPVKQRLETTVVVGARETSRNDKLRVA